MSEEEAPAVDPSPSPTSGPGDKIPGAEKKLVATYITGNILLVVSLGSSPFLTRLVHGL